MDLTSSYEQYLPGTVLGRYDFAEVRNAAAVLAASDPAAAAEIVSVITEFTLTFDMLTKPGKSKGPVARHLDREFREIGWREAKHRIDTTATLTLNPYRKAGERTKAERTTSTSAPGHQVDNVKRRVALDVEWNAKDGNLDRDPANFRALYDVGMIDVGVIVTRQHARTKYAANYLAGAAGIPTKYDKEGRPRLLLGTSTTTNLEKLVPRFERGDAGGCPVLVVAMTDRCYMPGPGEPPLPAVDDEAVLALADDDDLDDVDYVDDEK